MTRTETTGWAIRLDKTTKLDDRRVYLAGGVSIYRHPAFGAYRTMVFQTRAAAREYIAKEWGYLGDRPDLRAEPHCCRMPQPVKVVVTVQELG